MTLAKYKKINDLEKYKRYQIFIPNMFEHLNGEKNRLVYCINVMCKSKPVSFNDLYHLMEKDWTAPFDIDVRKYDNSKKCYCCLCNGQVLPQIETHIFRSSKDHNYGYIVCSRCNVQKKNYESVCRTL